MLSLLALTLAGQLLDPSILSSPSTMTVLTPPPFFEFAPSSGAGMTDACACTTPTGSKGETLTFTRTGDATCSKRGLATTGIQDGDLVYCAGNQARVMPDSDGVRGLLVESSRSNRLLRFIELGDAAWSDVGTPTLTTGQTSPWAGTWAASAVIVEDDDAAAYEGRKQSVTVTASQAHTMHCFVRAGSATAARISVDGTAANITGLSASTWNVVSVTDTSSSSTSIEAQVLVGDSVSATGSVVWGGCQVEQGSYLTSIIPTTTAAVTRNADLAYFTLAGAPGLAVGSMAATISPNSARQYATPIAAATALSPPTNVQNQYLLNSNGTSGASYRCVAGTSVPLLFGTSSVAPTGPSDGTHRGYCFVSGNTVGGGFGANVMTPSGAISGSFGAENYLFVGSGNNTLTFVDSIVTRVCRDPSPNRCR